MLADYQDLPNGGNGWLRIMEFRPADNRSTSRPIRRPLDPSGPTAMGDDTTSQDFTLAYDMAVPPRRRTPTWAPFRA